MFCFFSSIEPSLLTHQNYIHSSLVEFLRLPGLQWETRELTKETRVHCAWSYYYSMIIRFCILEVLAFYVLWKCDYSHLVCIFNYVSLNKIGINTFIIIAFWRGKIVIEPIVTIFKLWKVYRIGVNVWIAWRLHFCLWFFWRVFFHYQSIALAILLISPPIKKITVEFCYSLIPFTTEYSIA